MSYVESAQRLEHSKQRMCYGGLLQDPAARAQRRADHAVLRRALASCPTSGMCSPTQQHDVSQKVVTNFESPNQAYRAAGTLCPYRTLLCQAANGPSLRHSMPSSTKLAPWYMLTVPLALYRYKGGAHVTLNPTECCIVNHALYGMLRAEYVRAPARRRARQGLGRAMVASRILNLTLRMGSSHTAAPRACPTGNPCTRAAAGWTPELPAL